MQYLLMIYRSEAELGKMDAAARKEMSAEYGAFTQSIIQSGHFKAGDGLQPTTTATTMPRNPSGIPLPQLPDGILRSPSSMRGQSMPPILAGGDGE